MVKQFKRNSLILWIGIILVLGGAVYFLFPLMEERKGSQSLGILVIRWEDLWESLPEMELLKKNLNKKLESYHREFSTLEIQLRQENQNLSESQKTVNFKNPSQSKLFESRQKEFAEKVIKTQKEAEKRQKEINEHHEKSINKLRQRISEVIKEIAKKQKADLVIFHQQCPYYDPKFDITEKVLAALKTVEG